ncbi:tetratricopeptide repeat protein [Candidatus Poribacteria bacterium]|nr:tetratricopeptide repeat protein [Candidatus Poribacteria bacterium]
MEGSILGYSQYVLRLRWFFCVVAFCLMLFAIVEAQAQNIATLLERGKYHETAQLLEKLADSTDSVEQLCGIYEKLGDIYYAYTHQYPQALSVYDKIIQLSSKGATAEDLFLGYIKKGDVYCRMGKYEEAIQTYRTFADQFPPAHLAHKTGLRKIHSIQTALDDLQEQQRVIQEHKATPLAIEARFHIAELYRSPYQLNRPEKAIEVYEEILERRGDTKLASEAQWRIGNLRDKVLNQPVLAIEAYQKVVDNYHGVSLFAAEAFFQIGRIHLERGRYDRAVEAFEQLSEKHPDFWKMHAVFYWSGICYEKLRDCRRAIDAFQTFLYAYLPTLDPIYLGAIGKYDQDPARVKTELEAKIRQLELDFASVEWDRIQELIAASNYVDALPLTRQYIIDVPTGEHAQEARSQLREVELYATIQKLQSIGGALTPYALFRAGKIYERELNDYEQATATYRQLIEAHPQSLWAAEAVYRTGVVYAKHLNNTEKAIESYQTLISDYPSSSQTMMAHFQLGEMYRTLDQYDEAVKAYQTTIAYPKQTQHLAQGYKDSFADQAQFRIGHVHYENQRYDAAFATFQEFITNRPYSPRLAAAYAFLGDISHKRGDSKAALDAYDNAIRLLEGSPIQSRMMIDEAYELGFQESDPTAVIQHLNEHRKRVESR